MVSSAPEGSGFPIGLMPGALPSDQASRQMLKITATRLPPGHVQSTRFMPPPNEPRSLSLGRRAFEQGEQTCKKLGRIGRAAADVKIDRDDVLDPARDRIAAGEVPA